METVQAGWTVLADPGHPNFSERVRAFRPTGSPPPVFGRDVAWRMAEVIGSTFDPA